MNHPAAWVLNLDADVELASAARSRGSEAYSPSRAVRTAMAPHVQRLAASLLGPEDVLIDETSAPGSARGLAGFAFCPTARAIALLLRAGAVPEPHPPMDVLCEVNGRGFCASLGQTLPGATFVRDIDGALAALSRRPEVGTAWRAKRAFGMSGRGQRVIAPIASTAALEEADRVFLRAAIAEGGVQIEPCVAIERELAQHGVLEQDGALSIGRLVLQECDARGQWMGTTLASDAAADAATSKAIEAEVRRVGAALAHAGYFGPFGVDAFVYRGPEDAPRLQPRSEINARYSMGFCVGFPAR